MKPEVIVLFPERSMSFGFASDGYYAVPADLVLHGSLSVAGINHSPSICVVAGSLYAFYPHDGSLTIIPMDNIQQYRVEYSGGMLVAVSLRTAYLSLSRYNQTAVAGILMSVMSEATNDWRTYSPAATDNGFVFNAKGGLVPASIAWDFVTSNMFGKWLK